MHSIDALEMVNSAFSVLNQLQSVQYNSFDSFLDSGIGNQQG